MTNLRYVKLWHLIGALMIAFIFYMSLTPHPIQLSVQGSDKLYHFSGYFGVMAWYAQLLKRRSIAIVAFIVMGISLEFAQMLVNTRSFEWADMLANVAGVVIAALLFRGVLAKLLVIFEKYIATLK